MATDDRGSKDPETESGAIKIKREVGLASTSCAACHPAQRLNLCNVISPAFFSRHAKGPVA